jgi:hypothetical protein
VEFAPRLGTAKHKRSFSSCLKQHPGAWTFFRNRLMSNGLITTIDRYGKSYGISGIVFIPKEAASAVFSGNLKCICLDATFRALQPSKLCFVVGITANTYVPLGISVARSENVRLYQQFYDMFKKIIHYDLSTIPVLSDQGTALKLFCKQMGIQHFFCFTHILRNIGGNAQLLYAIAELLQLENHEDVPIFLSALGEILGGVLDDVSVQKQFKKVGLVCGSGKVEIDTKSAKFSQCVLAERLNFSIPMSTNILECIHSHINETITRSDSIWTSLSRIIEFIENRYANLEHYIKTKFSQKLNTIRKSFITDEETIQFEISKFSSTQYSCACQMTSRVANLYNLDIPCIHRLFLGVNWPTCDDLPLFCFPPPPFINSVLFTKDIYVNTKTESKISAKNNSQIIGAHTQMENAKAGLSIVTQVFERTRCNIKHYFIKISDDKFEKLFYNAFYYTLSPKYDQIIKVRYMKMEEKLFTLKVIKAIEEMNEKK